MRPLVDSRAQAGACLTPPEDAALRRAGILPTRRQARHVLPHGRGAFAPLCRAGRGGGGKGVSRPKKMLPVVGQASPRSEAPQEAPTDDPDACCGPGEDCCEAGAGLVAATPKTREANPEAPAVGALDGLEKTVVRVEGMDCASCAATVEKRVTQLPGMHRAVVNFAAGRLDAEHDPGLALAEIEKAVRDAGYGVESVQEVETPPFWLTPRAVSVFASALLFVLGLALSLTVASEVASVAAYLSAIAEIGRASCR